MMWCTVHDAPERCACGEAFGWCTNWDGILNEDQTTSCNFRPALASEELIAERRIEAQREDAL